MTEKQIEFEKDLDIILDYLKTFGYETVALAVIWGPLKKINSRYSSDYIRPLMNRMQSDDLLTINSNTVPEQFTMSPTGLVHFIGYEKTRKQSWIKARPDRWIKRWEFIGKPILLFTAIGSLVVSIISLCISLSNVEEKLKVQSSLDSIQIRMRYLEAKDKEKSVPINTTKPTPNNLDTLKKH